MNEEETRREAEGVKGQGIQAEDREFSGLLRSSEEGFLSWVLRSEYVRGKIIMCFKLLMYASFKDTEISGKTEAFG